MDLLATFLVVVWISLSNVGVGDSFNVVDSGAVGDGWTDDSQAFLRAWSAACGATGFQTVYIPNRTFLLKPVTFFGPCRSFIIYVKIWGTIVAPSTIDAWGNCQVAEWIGFRNVNNLVVTGPGTIDGQGSDWWRNAERRGCTRPKALSFCNCNKLQLGGLNLRNSPMAHVAVSSCKHAVISNLKITAPEDSPNTDGIDIAGSAHVKISDSFIGTGDDCIAINDGCSHINITHVNCGPGHGISVGSLGKGGSYETVENVHVRNCIFTKTLNGARIKTWPGGSGYVKNILFEHITVVQSDNPIIIDQHYLCQDPKCRRETKAVAISDVTFKNIKGTSASDQAIRLDCTGSGCNNIVMDQISLNSSVPGKAVYSYCKNVRGKATYTTPRVPCLPW